MSFSVAEQLNNFCGFVLFRIVGDGPKALPHCQATHVSQRQLVPSNVPVRCPALRVQSPKCLATIKNTTSTDHSPAIKSQVPWHSELAPLPMLLINHLPATTVQLMAGSLGPDLHPDRSTETFRKPVIVSITWPITPKNMKFRHQNDGLWHALPTSTGIYAYYF